MFSNPRLEVFKQLLPGLLPLIIFIIADEIWGTTIGLIVAIATGIIELIYNYIKEKRIEKFILLDTGLIIVLGVVSLVLKNDIFFKIKPGLIGIIFCSILAISAFSSKNIMLLMTQRYVKNVTINTEVENKMRHNIRNLFYIFSTYTLLVFYSAFFMSKEMWAFISGGLFYILFGVYFVYELIKNRYKIKRNQAVEEWLPIVNEKGQVIGKASRNMSHSNKQLMHPVVHLHIINHKKQLFLQKRPENKLIQPGKWDTSVGGHMLFGETIEQALVRETKEETGLSGLKAIPVARYKWESDIETELVFMFVALYNEEISVIAEEVQEGRFWLIKEIKENMGKGIFTPNFENEFLILQKHFLK